METIHIDDNFKKMLESSDDIEGRLSFVGRVVSTPQKHSPPTALKRAIASGVMRKRKPPKIAEKPKPLKQPELPEIYDFKSVMDMDDFIENFEKHFDISSEFYRKLMAKAVAYTSSMQVLSRTLQVNDEFRDLVIDHGLIDRIVRAYCIKCICDHFKIPPELFYTPPERIIEKRI